LRTKTHPYIHGLLCEHPAPMQILFVHPNYPAQFGHIAVRLLRERGVEAVSVTRAAPGMRECAR